MIVTSDRRRRHGMGDASDDPAYQAAREASATKWASVIESPDQAKAALGFVAQELHSAYEALAASDADFRTREQVRQMLDGLNNAARELYDAVETYEAQGIDFSDVAPTVGRYIGQLYYDVDRQLALTASITHFYQDGWTDAFWNSVAALPHMAKEAVHEIVDSARDAVNTAIGWPSWVMPVAAGIGALGLGAWAYFTFLAPVGASKALKKGLGRLLPSR